MTAKEKLIKQVIKKNELYGDSNFLRKGKFQVGDSVLLKICKRNYTRRKRYMLKIGYIVRNYVTCVDRSDLGTSRRNSYYRVFFPDVQRTLSIPSWLISSLENS